MKLSVRNDRTTEKMEKGKKDAQKESDKDFHL